MDIKRKEGLELLTRAMQASIRTMWEKLAPQILSRDGSDKYGIDIASDAPLQKLIVNIYKGFIPAFSHQAWTEYQLLKGLPVILAAGKHEDCLPLVHEQDRAKQATLFYANIAYKKLFTHLLKASGREGDGVEIRAKDQAYALMGSIISRVTEAFNKALYEHNPDYLKTGVRVLIPDITLSDHLPRPDSPQGGIGR